MKMKIIVPVCYTTLPAVADPELQIRGEGKGEGVVIQTLR